MGGVGSDLAVSYKCIWCKWSVLCSVSMYTVTSGGLLSFVLWILVQLQ